MCAAGASVTRDDLSALTPGQLVVAVLDGILTAGEATAELRRRDAATHRAPITSFLERANGREKD